VLKAYKRYLSFLMILAGFLYYGVFVEPNQIIVKTVSIRDDTLFRAWKDIRIVQLSDLHISRLGPREKKVVSEVSRIRPDLICITGDLAQWDASNNDVMEFLDSLHATYGVFIVLGDADMSIGRGRCSYCHVNGNIYEFRKKPVFLRNRLFRLKLNMDGSLYVLGLSPNLDAETFGDLWKNIRKDIPVQSPVLVLSHFSSLWDMVLPNDHVLWLSGDTHGGQVALPSLVWPLFFGGKDFRHLRGLYGSGSGKWLYVNQGIGTTLKFPIRIGVLPEITLFSFAPAK